MGFNGVDHLIENKLEGGLHSGKLIQALLKKVQGLGVQVLTGISVNGYTKIKNKILVDTSYAPIQTRQLLLCTNAFTKELIPGIDIVTNRGQVLITNPIKNLKIKGTFHFDKGYYYFRNLGSRLLLGGARNSAFEQENTLEMDITAGIQEKLEKFIHEYLLPDISFYITDRWSGIMAMGTEKLPIVQELDDNIFCCVRMSGMGVALAPVAAQEAAQLIRSALKKIR
ncbi:MAG: FAD-binding oxidoreductase [Chitinophagaceae bacterium]|nr:FAD-binding oxidoreductase [Chitinophagaceae bacterium]